MNSRRPAAGTASICSSTILTRASHSSKPRARFRNAVVQGTGGKQILLEDPSGNLVELFEANTAAYRAPGSGSKAAGA